jgi:hypothetical protein
VWEPSALIGNAAGGSCARREGRGGGGKREPAVPVSEKKADIHSGGLLADHRVGAWKISEKFEIRQARLNGT